MAETAVDNAKYRRLRANGVPHAQAVAMAAVTPTADFSPPSSLATDLELSSALAVKAPLASPAFTGTPTKNGSPVQSQADVAGAYVSRGAVSREVFIDPLRLVGRNSLYGATKLAITTYVGGNNEVVEPSVWFDPDRWNGYEYWMVAGPYEGSNAAYENPSIWCSHDGQTWIVPAGVTNPIQGPPASGNYDDPHITVVNGVMYLTWNWSRGAGLTDQVLLSSSSDGVTWSAAQAILTGTDTAAHDLVSPHVEYLDGTWHMWTLSQSAPSRSLTHRTATSITDTWSAPTTCTAALPTGKDHWEFEVRRVGGVWWMLQNLVDTGQTSTGGELWFRTSTDGVTWTLASKPVLNASASTTGFDRSWIYKSSFVPYANGNVGIWYSTNGLAANRWAIGYGVATERPTSTPMRTNSWYAPPCAVSAALLVQGRVLFIPMYFDRPTVLSNIGLEVTVAGSTGAIVELGIYHDDNRGEPGALLLDAGSIDGTTTGIKTLAAGVTAGPGVVWFAALGLGSPTTQPTVRIAAGPTPTPIGVIGGTATLASQNALAGLRLDSQTALPTYVAISSLTAVLGPARLVFQTAAL